MSRKNAQTKNLDCAHMESHCLSSSDESELLDKMPLVMRIAIAVDINLATFQKIALFQVRLLKLQRSSTIESVLEKGRVSGRIMNCSEV